MFSSFSIDWYWLIVLPVTLGCVFAFAIFYLKNDNTSFNMKLAFRALFFSICIVSSGFLGSKAFSILEKVLLGVTLLEAIKSPGGARLYGAVFFGVVSAIIMNSTVSKERPFKVLDIISLIASIGFAFGKIGCYLSGHPGCYGIKTNAPWGVRFAFEGTQLSFPVHPVQLYDCLFYFLLFTFSLIINKKTKTSGTTFFILITSMSIYNIFIECIRDNPSVWSSLSLAQLIYALFLLLMALFIITRRVNFICKIPKAQLD
jgi:prolipoprotein diacylglyceryltransferase